MNEIKKTVAVLGASQNPERYSNQTVRLLLKHGHQVIPVHPTIAEIEGLPVAAALSEISEAVDTLTVYLSPARAIPLKEEFLVLRPNRVIFNPGTESPELKQALEQQGIQTEEACTLVLLHTGQF